MKATEPTEKDKGCLLPDGGPALEHSLISVGSLARLRNSPQNVTLLTLAKISRALGITPSQLLDDADAHHRANKRF